MENKNKKHKESDNLSSALSDLDAGLDLEDMDMNIEDETPDPLAHIRKKDYANNQEAQKEMMSEALIAFKASAKGETELKDATTDACYFFCMAFKSSAQRDAFIEHFGWQKTSGYDYLDGVVIAKKMGIPLPDAKNRFITQERDKGLATTPDLCIDPATAKASLKTKS